ncbi:anthocyanidin 5,3-O-glucosyltransferase-like [Lolium rigidum]|uniref:anthocyanidin 5,3-O-glucosyltransferase-like n=1 Tax=Lolium rigidum TaxID=89674 RepID=UPI001F5D9836|nr:anthocyanidin 5,3-O-glucosyltransferase-like [Lolium rigidum]
MGSSVVLYTWMVRGHLHPMTQLADHLAGHGVPVTVAVADVPSTGESSQTIARLSATYPTVSFHLLPPAPTRSAEDAADPNADPFITLIADLRATNTALLAFLRSLPPVKALVADFFCAYGLDAATELGVPAYVFFSLCASALATFLHIPVLRPAVSFGEMGRSLLQFPGVHPIPASDLPEALLDRDNMQYDTILGLFEQLPRATGILSNTFDWLEPRAVKAIKDGTPRPGESMPKLFCVGPLVGEERGGNKIHESLSWLDKQPAGSVVFLCFGSASSVPAEQLNEIAVGLEKSGHAFLWAVRAPVAPDADSTKRFEGRGDAAVEALLPDGFLDRTRGRGMVVSSWAPQVEVLRHPAIGAFVTHCGWNSIMEAVTAGVPMLCWPMYAEQRMNKVFIAEDMKLGVTIDGYDEVMVKAGQVEAKVRLVMDSEHGKEIRDRTMLAKQMAADALECGGSSTAACLDFINSINISTPH